MEAKIKLELGKVEDYLAQRNLKLTSGRKAVFNEIMHTHGHFPTEDIVKSCNNKKRKVSRATIYRCVRELLEAGVVRETAFGDKHQHYEHIYDEKPHHHARCMKCADILEFPDLKEDKIYVPYLEKAGFKILGHEMHFYGICKKCQ